MPVSMVVGIILCRPVGALETMTHGMITPVLIFCMLFITFCRVKPRRMRFSMLYVWMLVFQIVGSAAIYGAFVWYDPLLAQGALICVLAPVAMAAVVVGGMLGADITTLATYSLIANLAVALFAPVAFALIGAGGTGFWGILSRVAPLLIGPFVLAQICRWVLPRTAHWLAWHHRLSFYLWLVSLVIIIGRTTVYIIDLHGIAIATMLLLAGISLVLCLVQFRVGRILGRRWGDGQAGAQALGQKNTILAIWMCHSFLDPVSSIAPTAYIVWQNIVNSCQLYRKSKKGY